MTQNNFISKIVYTFFEKLFSVKENKSRDIGSPQKIIIIRQHNQLGDLLAGVSLLRAIKETFPASHLTLIVSPFNYPGVIKNKFIDRLVVFDKLKIYNPSYFNELYNLLREPYDLAVVPVTVSISFTSNLLARISNAKIRIGPESLNGKLNNSSFFFDRRVIIDWRKYPDSNVAERSLDILRPFGINTKNYRSEISFDKEDIKTAEEFISGLKLASSDKSNYAPLGHNESGYLPADQKILRETDKALTGGLNLNLNLNFLIGFHVGAGKVPNRWSLNKYIELMTCLKENYKVKFYLTGSSSDMEEINYIKEKAKFPMGLFINHKIPEVAALISKTDLFISNDTGIMHVAGATDTPQISIFGPTNPFNWAPVGENKFFIRKSELIDDVTVEDVYAMCTKILSRKIKEINDA